MKYFQTIPKIASIDYIGNYVVLTNLLVRAEIIPSLLNNPALFYQYDIQDGDTPEIIADKYYGDSYRYWLVLFANQIIDPQWNWPMNTNLFKDYLVDKYTSATANAFNVSANTVTYAQISAYTEGTVKNYVKTITTTDSVSETSTTNTFYLDQVTYDNVITGTTTKSFPPGKNSSGGSITQVINKYTQSIYDYENQQNESMRSINLINSVYVPQFEAQFKSLMAQ
jgi:predicted DNA-binding ArsR family transcriptional regulator